jgi:tyramine---L-glutamate ligase
MLKILVFEFITGGGFNKEVLPNSMAQEGRLMLEGILKGFAQVKDIQLTVMLDRRFSETIKADGVEFFMVTSADNVSKVFTRLVQQADAVWPVAPEFDSILEKLCETVETFNKWLLTSSAKAVALTGNKFKTFQQLSQHNIPTVKTRLLTDNSFSPGEWLVKPIDGAGCNDSYLVTSPDEFSIVSERFALLGSHIIQPHLKGKKTSLSCLFKQGASWLLSINEQHFKIVNRQYHLTKIVVNCNSDFKAYEAIVSKIAKVFPGLWGYAGIDLIETPEEIKVLEINPRLTTSFAGLQTTGHLNICRNVLELLDGEPVINGLSNEPFVIEVSQDACDV